MQVSASWLVSVSIRGVSISGDVRNLCVGVSVGIDGKDGMMVI